MGESGVEARRARGGCARKSRLVYAKMSMWERLARKGVVKRGRCTYKTEGVLGDEGQNQLVEASNLTEQIIIMSGTLLQCESGSSYASIIQ